MNVFRGPKAHWSRAWINFEAAKRDENYLLSFVWKGILFNVHFYCPEDGLLKSTSFPIPKPSTLVVKPVSLVSVKPGSLNLLEPIASDR